MISALMLGVASAQTASEIVAKVDAAQRAAKDISFKVTGTANLESGAQKFDMDLSMIPAQNLVRVNFNAPDALADNVIISDGKKVYNYLYLTNQVTVQDVSKTTSAAGFNVNFAQFADASQYLTSRYTVKIVDTATQGGAKVFVLEATPKDGGNDRNRVWITDQGWRPVRVQSVNSAGRVVADLSISNYKTNSGLTATKLKALPKDAEVIKR